MESVTAVVQRWLEDGSNVLAGAAPTAVTEEVAGPGHGADGSHGSRGAEGTTSPPPPQETMASSNASRSGSAHDGIFAHNEATKFQYREVKRKVRQSQKVRAHCVYWARTGNGLCQMGARKCT